MFEKARKQNMKARGQVEDDANTSENGDEEDVAKSEGEEGDKTEEKKDQPE